MEKLRTHLILDYLKRQRRCSVAELMRKFKVSSATIHRDIDELSRRDAVMRVRGGLVFNDARTLRTNANEYKERVVTNRADKQAIARQALPLVAEGDILFLDSSTTVCELAMLLQTAAFQHLTIVTNSLSVMRDFGKFPANYVLIALGGNYDAQLNAFLGAETLEQLGHLNITKAFVSAFGLDAKVATTNHERQAEIIRRVLAAADKRYLLVDRSKIGRTGLHRLAARGGFDKIISA